MKISSRAVTLVITSVALSGCYNIEAIESQSASRTIRSYAADNDAQYVAPYSGVYGAYKDNDAQYVAPRYGYGTAYRDNDAQYVPYRGNPNPGYAYAPKDELEQWDFQ